MKLKVSLWARQNIFLIVVTTLAVVSCFFIPPSSKYFSYINYKTLLSLFCLMLITCALQHTMVFKLLSAKLLRYLNSPRKLALMLVFLPAIMGMFVSNDVTIITFAPFTLLILSIADKSHLSVKILVLQLIATNSISCLSPLGNSQSLYIFNFFNLSIGEYLKIMAPFCLSSAIIVFFFCMRIENDTFKPMVMPKISIDTPRCILYASMLIFTLLAVFGVLSFITVLPLVVVPILFLDKKAFSRVNYPLLLLFFMFFILTGNLRNIPAISNFLFKIIDGREYVLSASLSLAISNTPSTLLLAPFALNPSALLMGVNVGKCGTFHASLNSFIAKEFYEKLTDKHTKFLPTFFKYNSVFFVLSFGVGYLILFIYGLI